MQWVIGVSFGELFLKGKNRKLFVDKALRQIRKATKNFEIEAMHLQQGKLYIYANREDFDEIIEKVKKVFGIAFVSIALRSDKGIDDIKRAIIELLDSKFERTDAKTFKISTKRVDKNYPLTSPELNAEFGGVVLDNFENFKVDVHNPQVDVKVEVKQDAYVSIDRYDGVGGLPMGSGGRAMLLLSGGIDSPVAGYEIAKRGVELACVHFHSFPFTSQRAEQKSVELAQKLSELVGDMTFYSVNLMETYTQIRKNCDERYTTILARRIMMRITEKLAIEDHYDAMITGESLGQVASQTIQGISVVNEATSLPILRPLIAMDKTNIIKIAEYIDTYDISIEPYDDCCSFFAPSRPITKPRIADIKKQEEKLDIDSLLDNAIIGMKRFRIKN